MRRKRLVLSSALLASALLFTAGHSNYGAEWLLWTRTVLQTLRNIRLKTA